MAYKIETLMISMMWVSAPEILSALGTFVLIVYYVSKLRKDVVNPDFGGNWIKYLKSWNGKK